MTPPRHIFLPHTDFSREGLTIVLQKHWPLPSPPPKLRTYKINYSVGVEGVRRSGTHNMGLVVTATLGYRTPINMHAFPSTPSEAQFQDMGGGDTSTLPPGEREGTTAAQYYQEGPNRDSPIGCQPEDLSGSTQDLNMHFSSQSGLPS